MERQPIPDPGRWCDLCDAKVATMVSADGVAACEPCAEIALFNLMGNRKMRRQRARDKIIMRRESRTPKRKRRR